MRSLSHMNPYQGGKTLGEKLFQSIVTALVQRVEFSMFVDLMRTVVYFEDYCIFKNFRQRENIVYQRL